MAAYVAFARTGDPNNSEIPAWAPYDGVRRATMTLNTECRLVEDYRGADRIAQLAAPSQESFELLAGPMFLGDRGTIPKSVA
jgi:para-nitrobenzyl esterase